MELESTIDNEKPKFKNIVFDSSVSSRAIIRSTGQRSSLSMRRSNSGINDCVDDEHEEELLGLFRSGSFTDIARQTINHKLTITMHTDDTVIHRISPGFSKPVIKVQFFIAATPTTDEC